jgi:hypothetical protein
MGSHYRCPPTYAGLFFDYYEREAGSMADIEGTWEFHRSCPAQVMNIDGVAPDGELLGDSYIGDSSRLIGGHYDAATNAISFNDASRLGETLNVSFYSGYVIPDGKGGACASSRRLILPSYSSGPPRPGTRCSHRRCARLSPIPPCTPPGMRSGRPSPDR